MDYAAGVVALTAAALGECITYRYCFKVLVCIGTVLVILSPVQRCAEVNEESRHVRKPELV